MEHIGENLRAAVEQLPLDDMISLTAHLTTARQLMSVAAAGSDSAELRQAGELLEGADTSALNAEVNLFTTRARVRDYLASTSLGVIVAAPVGGEPPPDLSLKDKKKYLWNRFREAHSELRDVVNTLGERAAATIASSLRVCGADGLDAAVDRLTVLRLPSGDDQFVMLPPHVFGNLDDPDWNPRYPQDDAELEAMKQAYLTNRAQGWMQDQPQDKEWGAYARSVEYADELFAALVRLRDTGVELDMEGWERYRQEALRQQATGVYDLDFACQLREEGVVNMRRNVANSDILRQMGAERVDIHGCMHRTGNRHPTMANSLMPQDLVYLPVSEYGPSWTNRLLKTVVAAKEDVAYVRDEPDIVQMATEHTRVIKAHTARGATSPPDVPPHETLGYTVEEAVVSIAQTMALFTAYKVPGYENDPEGLLREIRDKGLIEEFTRETPAGFIGPATLSGSVVPDILVNGPDGLQLNPRIMAELKAAKARQVDAIHRQWSEESVDVSQMMGLICPAVMPRGSLSSLTRVLVDSVLIAR